MVSVSSLLVEVLNYKREGATQMKIYSKGYVCFEEFGHTKITSKENYEALIRNERQVVNFDGTIEEAVEYVEKYFIRKE